ncbi:DUF5916 domain-containing protein [Gammaproteobacteria bacterium]|jgi:hypothetical protein|nr:hypothetical protein [Gammaproteobacteria bacterium]MCH9854436.1 hypothetical protein [Gammaproteobacteria bacterium]MDA7692115.1 DUF5916 domain-containing protein [Gammaproteobacteria bacterium]MDB2484843.1 DUF5916 domain-containing protein [Gammaproteobacteria bacterium]MDB4164920.1 DUF5916 domain-containing protein [Gammaproteobacteria bacterium]
MSFAVLNFPKSTLRLASIICLLASLPLSELTAQNGIAVQLPQITRIEQSDAEITIDGFIDEDVWKDLPVIDGMKVIDPDTLADTPYETHVRFFYTERGIYLSAMNFQPQETLMARMTSRDVRLERDGFVVAIDASGEGLYGFYLRINLGNSLTDATILPERTFNFQWDGPWLARTQALENGWSAEYYIPWSMMPLPQVDDDRKIGIYLERQVGHLQGEAWANPPLPGTVNQFLSAFEKYELKDIEPRRQLTYYPFASGIYDGVRDESTYKVGTEIFWRPTSNSLLSASLNPDFGNVESDDVVVNLTAFEVFFPERRVFFLEGQDVFNTSPRTSSRGGPGGPISLLNTRRIGGAAIYDVPDEVNVVPTDLSQPSELIGAVKLTGQSGNWRYGTLLASETESQIAGTLDDGTQVTLNAVGRDFSIARLLYEDTSSGGRRAIGWMGTNLSHPTIDATAHAVDMHYFSADNRFVIDTQIMHSNVDGKTGNGFLGDVAFRPRRGLQHGLRATYIDDTLDINELGFLTRNDQMNLDYNMFNIESDVPGLRQRTTSLFISNQWNTDGEPVRLGLFLNRGYNTLNNNTYDVSLRYFPERIDDRLGRGTGDFKVEGRYGLNLGFRTNPADKLAFNFDLNLDQDELGPARTGASARFTWRPNDRFSSDLRLDYTDREALLVHKGSGSYTSFESHQWAPRLEMNYFLNAWQQLRFTLQWTALKAFEDRFWQVDSQNLDFLQPVAKSDEDSDNFTISRLTFQARYRWEIAPLSDLFVVYTRGSNLPTDSFETFQDLLVQSWTDTIVDTLAIKLRYRFGS